MIAREPEFFLTCGFHRMLDNHPLLLHTKNQKNRQSRFLSKSEKVSFWPFLAIFGQMRFFLKNRAPSVFSIYGPLTSCKKSEKVRKTSFLGIFFPKKGTRDFFFKNRAPSLFSIYGPLTSCKKNPDKSVDPHRP